jgi:iodotyrosine deiodinase
MAARHSVRFISSEPVEFELVKNAIRLRVARPHRRKSAAMEIRRDAEIQRQIREAAEAEERESYEHRMPEDWL